VAKRCYSRGLRFWRVAKFISKMRAIGGSCLLQEQQSRKLKDFREAPKSSVIVEGFAADGELVPQSAARVLMERVNFLLRK
jgi:hypothetical protein